jgi:hypothetical protein
MRVLRRVEPKMLIIDEAHDLLAGSYRDQRCALNLLKGLANDLRIPVIAVGTEDARHAIQTDPQVASRFDPLHLARWKESDAFRNFVAAFGKLPPLRKATLTHTDVCAVCGLCLDEDLCLDRDPYLRAEWRQSWRVFCSLHEVRLLPCPMNVVKRSCAALSGALVGARAAGRVPPLLQLNRCFGRKMRRLSKKSRFESKTTISQRAVLEARLEPAEDNGLRLDSNASAAFCSIDD